MGEHFSQRETPAFHGYAPREQMPDDYQPPLSLTISRETGSRGRAIARRTAEILGWDLIAQEALEYGTGSPGFTTGYQDSLSPSAEHWVQAQLAMRLEHGLMPTPEQELFLRSVLEIAAIGNHVILGETAHFLLPAQSRLAIRLMAPERDRVAYIAEVERLTRADAQRYVHDCDQASLGQATIWQGWNLGSDVDYDLILNTTLFGIEGCSVIIASAARERQEHLA